MLIKWCNLRIQLEVTLFQEEVGWDHAVLDGQGRLEYAGNASGALCVTDHRLDAANKQRRSFLLIAPRIFSAREESLGNRLRFLGIPCWSSGS